MPSMADSGSTSSSITTSEHLGNDQYQDYLLRLEGPISSAARVAEIAGLPAFPKTFEGASETDTVASTVFCKVDCIAKRSILTWISQHHPSFRPLFITRSLARKNFDTTSISPTVGRYASLPQHRLITQDAIPRPSQDEYPVWYFFYGTLANPQTLHTLLKHLDGEDYDMANYKLRPARVTGAELTSWGNKYKALVDGEDEVDGRAFWVASELHEEALRSYETSA